MGRKNGVRPASKTSIEIDFYYHGVRCKERLKLKPTPANLKRAERHRAAILDAIERGTFDYAVTFPNSPRGALFSHEPGAALPLRDYLDRWLKEIRGSLKSSTFVPYRRIINHQIIDEFGHLTLTQISWKEIRDWLAKKDASLKTKRNILSVFRTALDDAVEDELIDANPLAGKKIRRKGETKPKKDEIDPFSADERHAILAKADGQERNFLQVGFWTGMRISELIALEWGDVDWVNKRIFVQRALTQHSEEPETPKTAAGKRHIKLLPAAYEALKNQKNHTYLACKEIFHNPRTGKRWSGDVVIRERMWKRILLRAGVRYRYPYQMRHTYASMMLLAGESVMWVAQQMGHRDWAFTARTYSRWVSLDAPNAGNLAAEKWGSGECGPKNGPNTPKNTPKKVTQQTLSD